MTLCCTVHLTNKTLWLWFGLVLWSCGCHRDCRAGSGPRPVGAEGSSHQLRPAAHEGGLLQGPVSLWRTKPRRDKHRARGHCYGWSYTPHTTQTHTSVHSINVTLIGKSPVWVGVWMQAWSGTGNEWNNGRWRCFCIEDSVLIWLLVVISAELDDSDIGLLHMHSNLNSGFICFRWGVSKNIFANQTNIPVNTYDT